MSTSTLTATARIFDGDPITSEALPGRHHRPMAKTTSRARPRDRYPRAMTSRTAELLSKVADLVYVSEREWLDDTQGLDSMIVRKLPDAAAQMCPAWRYRFAECFNTWHRRLIDGAPLTPQNTGEEMALHLLLDLASEFVEDSQFGVTLEETVFGIPPCGNDATLEQVLSGIPACDDDFRFDALADELLEDIDVLLLFEPDGQEWAAADTILAPRNWFLPFR